MSAISQRKVPVQPSERIVFIDVLRGFAVFGILVAKLLVWLRRIVDGLFAGYRMEQTSGVGGGNCFLLLLVIM